MDLAVIAGWDDAPLKNITPKFPFHTKPVTLIYPYYENAGFLSRQLDWWWKLDSTLRDMVRLIIVDDGSPKNPARAVLQDQVMPFKTRLFEIGVDVPWNWLAARNIAMHHAPDGWCLGTDMDHIVPHETFENVVWAQHDEWCIYRFLRRDHKREIKPHPNSWFMTREMFWCFGGYDEALSGHYGTDGDARRRWAKTAQVWTLPVHLERWEHCGDSSTTAYKRKLPEDAVAVQKLIAQRGQDWKPKTLSFPYKEVQL